MTAIRLLPSLFKHDGTAAVCTAMQTKHTATCSRGLPWHANPRPLAGVVVPGVFAAWQAEELDTAIISASS